MHVLVYRASSHGVVISFGVRQFTSARRWFGGRISCAEYFASTIIQRSQPCGRLRSICRIPELIVSAKFLYFAKGSFVLRRWRSILFSSFDPARRMVWVAHSIVFSGQMALSTSEVFAFSSFITFRSFSIANFASSACPW